MHMLISCNGSELLNAEIRNITQPMNLSTRDKTQNGLHKLLLLHVIPLCAIQLIIPMHTFFCYTIVTKVRLAIE